MELGPSKDGTTDAENWFADVYQETYRVTLAFALRRVGSLADAEDIVEEAFATAWRRREEFRVVAAPQAWIYTVARGVMRNHRRSEKRRSDLSEAIQQERSDAVSNDPASIYERSAEITEVERALAQLPAKDQELLRLVGYEDMGHSDIGLVLGIPGPLVRAALYRARRRLNQVLAAGIGYEESGTGYEEFDSDGLLGPRVDESDD